MKDQYQYNSNLVTFKNASIIIEKTKQDILGKEF